MAKAPTRRRGPDKPLYDTRLGAGLGLSVGAGAGKELHDRRVPPRVTIAWVIDRIRPARRAKLAAP